MIRVVQQGLKLYGLNIDKAEPEEEFENIKTFVEDEGFVIIVNKLDDLKRFNIETEDVEMID